MGGGEGTQPRRESSIFAGIEALREIVAEGRGRCGKPWRIAVVRGLRTHVHARIHARTHARRLRVRKHTHTHTLTQICTRARTHTHARTRTHTRTHARTHTHRPDEKLVQQPRRLRAVVLLLLLRPFPAAAAAAAAAFLRPPAPAASAHAAPERHGGVQCPARDGRGGPIHHSDPPLYNMSGTTDRTSVNKPSFRYSIARDRPVHGRAWPPRIPGHAAQTRPRREIGHIAAAISGHAARCRRQCSLETGRPRVRRPGRERALEGGRTSGRRDDRHGSPTASRRISRERALEGGRTSDDRHRRARRPVRRRRRRRRRPANLSSKIAERRESSGRADGVVLGTLIRVP